MSLFTLTRLSLVVATSFAIGCSATLDSASQEQVDQIIAATENSAARATTAATKAEAAAMSAKASAERAAAAAQKSEAILSRTMRK